MHRQLLTDPNAVAVADDRISLTVTEVQESASWVAREIWKARTEEKSILERCTAVDGEEPNEFASVPTVALFVEKSVVCVLSSLGALMSGTRVATVEASASDAEVTRVLGIVKPATVITSKALRPRLPVSLLCDPTIILIDDMPMGAAGEPVNDGASKPAPLSFLPAPDEEGASVAKESRDEGALCVLTSGTTSLSKIVILRHDALSCATNYMCEDVERNRGDRVGLFWVYYYMLSAIGLGATVFVLPDTTFFNPTALVSSVRENRLTGLYLTPSILTSCLQVISEAQLATDLATLRVIWLTGERVTSKMRARLNRVLPWVRVRNVYSTNESGDNAIADSDDTFTMIEGTEFEVLDPVTLLPVPDGEVGALHVRCPWLFLGYWTVEGLSYAADANERFRTGDLVRCLGGRTISFESRESASHIKVRGFKVFPELIEAELIKVSSRYKFRTRLITTAVRVDLEPVIRACVEAVCPLPRIGLRNILTCLCMSCWFLPRHLCNLSPPCFMSSTLPSTPLGSPLSARTAMTRLRALKPPSTCLTTPSVRSARAHCAPTWQSACRRTWCLSPSAPWRLHAAGPARRALKATAARTASCRLSSSAASPRAASGPARKISPP